MNCFTTVVSADHFQYYIPMYVAALRTWSRDNIVIFLRGKLDPEVSKLIGDATVMEDQFLDYPNLVSTTNCLRFIVSDGLQRYDHVMVTDIDLLLFENPWYWHMALLQGRPFAGHHGPRRKPRRPEICSSWENDYERFAGGFFMITKDWWPITAMAREIWATSLRSGAWGTFREADEVMLARIIKGSQMDVPQSKVFPTELRGIHIGDFKFDHRWTDQSKMEKLLDKKAAFKYYLIKDKVDKVVALNGEIKALMDNVSTYIGLATK